MVDGPLRPLEWIGSSKSDLLRFPEPVKDRMGFALYQAQAGLTPRDAKPLKGMGGGVLEVITRHDGGTYRTVYTVRFKGAVYVLHAFQKKASTGIATPKKEMDLVKSRLQAAERHYRAAYQGRDGHD